MRMAPKESQVQKVLKVSRVQPEEMVYKDLQAQTVRKDLSAQRDRREYKDLKEKRVTKEIQVNLARPDLILEVCGIHPLTMQ